MKREIPARIELVCDRCDQVVIEAKHLEQEPNYQAEWNECEWDLCRSCLDSFYAFMRGEKVGKIP